MSLNKSTIAKGTITKGTIAKGTVCDGTESATTESTVTDLAKDIISFDDENCTRVIFCGYCRQFRETKDGLCPRSKCTSSLVSSRMSFRMQTENRRPGEAYQIMIEEYHKIGRSPYSFDIDKEEDEDEGGVYCYDFGLNPSIYGLNPSRYQP